MRKFFALLGALLTMGAPIYAESTRSAVEGLMKRCPPALEYREDMPADSFAAWQGKMSEAMASIMKHPEAQAKAPEKILERQRNGYRIEKWMSYPLEGSGVAYYVLIPDTLRGGAQAAPAVLCIPGFGQTKELLAGERAGNFNLEGDPVEEPGKSAMALHFVKKGLVAVAVDNPSCGELSDNGYPDYVTSSRFLLELGWSYLGLASWQDKVILDWMKTQPYIRPDRLIVSGFSLGTEPLMVLGLIDPSIYAFVYNDFLCRTRERALSMNKPDENGARSFPNNIEHLIPDFLTTFDFPDIVAALAPRPVICTEGGMDRDFRIISTAFDKAGAPDAFTYHHYVKFADPADRVPLEEMPSGIDRAEFFRLANVDPPHHYFKTEWILPWLDNLLNQD
ncbi:MAG: hypothetical protein HDR92_03980 [Bacteroides sp.]|nr:hypothetical protein [Bacteroides sp.]